MRCCRGHELNYVLLCIAAFCWSPLGADKSGGLFGKSTCQNQGMLSQRCDNHEKESYKSVKYSEEKTSDNDS